ncbi:hypothetical protein ACFY0B_27220 [Streptomyces sp. NPDC001797]|uniref:hypothetical protein n=1 Tax=Streptomyces sp. NPDC001797 TaxID=3364610 RepID=UPI0036BBFDF8
MAPVAWLIDGRTRNRGAVPYVRPRADEHPATRPPVPGRSPSTMAGTARTPWSRAAPQAPDRPPTTRSVTTRSVTTRSSTSRTPSAPALVRV